MDAGTKQQVGRFIIAGLLATGSDALVYFGLVYSGVALQLYGAAPALATFGLPSSYELAKACSFLVGTLVSFYVNKLWTFERPERDTGEALAFFALYGVTFTLNVGTNYVALSLLGALAAPPRLAEVGAFLVATGSSTVANFIGQKFWVFRSGGPPQASG